MTENLIITRDYAAIIDFTNLYFYLPITTPNFSLCAEGVQDFQFSASSDCCFDILMHILWMTGFKLIFSYKEETTDKDNCF